MKKYFGALLLILFFVSSCQKEDPVLKNDQFISTEQIKNTVTTGNWKITYYWDTNTDETSNFTGYTFNFNTSGSLTATKQSSPTITGTWSALGDANNTKLILNFAAPAPFLEISDDWSISEFTDSKIKMQDISGGNGGIDFLTLEKI